MGRRRARAIGWAVATATATATAAVGAAPADARRHRPPPTIEVSVSGAASVTWHGDSARGCGAAGLCGYRGALTIRAAGDEELSFPLGAGDSVGYFGASDAVVRVRREEADGTTGGCVDTASGADQLFLRLVPVGSKRVRVSLDADGPIRSRCAGPRIAAPLRRLRAHTIALPRRDGPARTVALTGTLPYGSGRFSGTFTSALRARIRNVHTPRDPFQDFEQSGGGSSRPPRARERRLVSVRAHYRIKGFGGGIASTFQGLPRPTCVTLDACGVTGAAGWSIDGARGDLYVEGVVPARRSDRGLRGAIAAVARDGGDTAGAFAQLGPRAAGTATADVRRADGATCHDSATTAAPALDAELGPRRLRIVLGAEEPGPSLDVLGTGCPGPAGPAVFGEVGVAAAGVPVAWLARRGFAVALNGSGGGTDAGYRASSSSHFAMRVERVSARVSYRRGRVGEER
jgi:hypothetical protein